MTVKASADSDPQSDHQEETLNQEETTEANHDLPARIAEDKDDEPPHDQHSDDPATAAASEELKHTTISDKVNMAPDRESVTEDTSPVIEDKVMEEPPKASTPEPDTFELHDHEMRERISSPKKKRGRDFEDDIKDIEGDDSGHRSSSDGGPIGSRTIRSEPEKKRPRDTSEDPPTAAIAISEKREKVTADAADKAKMPAESEEPKVTSVSTKIFGSGKSDLPPTSTSAFASSGFGALAGSATSPFGAVGAAKPSIFGAGTTASGFGSLAGATKPSDVTGTTTSVLGSGGSKPTGGFGFGSATPSSGFGGLGSGSVFSSAISNGFAAGAGPKLSSFAAPPGNDNAPLSKPAKAFGAPDSDEDEGSDGDDGDDGTDSEDDGGVKVSPEEKKRSKLTKVHIEDGESGEATLVQLRAKLFALDNKEAGWKERGVGTLKINVPKLCASYDENGVPIPGSFDVSGFDCYEEDDDTPKVPRLVMRQENTHRVILNTIIVKALEFKDKPSTSTAQIMFTAFEGDQELKPVNMLLKMSENNARLFRSEIDSIQHEL